MRRICYPQRYSTEQFDTLPICFYREVLFEKKGEEKQAEYSCFIEARTHIERHIREQSHTYKSIKFAKAHCKIGIEKINA